MTKSIIELKGSTFTLPVICLYSDNIQDIETTLSEKIKQAPQILKNASVIVNIASMPDLNEFAPIAALLKKHDINLVGFSGCTQEQKQALLETGFSVLSEGKSSFEKKKSASTISPNTPYFPALVIDSPVRSGQQIYARNCDLIINDAVSTGAEVISDGNIHIYSVVRGKIIAGADGNENAHIYCTQLEAELISIAGHYWLSEQIPTEFYKKPVKISIQNNTLFIQPLHISI